MKEKKTVFFRMLVWFGFVVVEQSVTATHQYSLIMKHFYPGGSAVFQDDPTSNPQCARTQ